MDVKSIAPSFVISLLVYWLIAIAIKAMGDFDCYYSVAIVMIFPLNVYLASFLVSRRLQRVHGALVSAFAEVFESKKVPQRGSRIVLWYAFLILQFENPRVGFAIGLLFVSLVAMFASDLSRRSILVQITLQNSTLIFMRWWMLNLQPIECLYCLILLAYSLLIMLSVNEPLHSVAVCKINRKEYVLSLMFVAVPVGVMSALPSLSADFHPALLATIGLSYIPMSCFAGFIVEQSWLGVNVTYITMVCFRSKSRVCIWLRAMVVSAVQVLKFFLLPLWMMLAVALLSFVSAFGSNGIRRRLGMAIMVESLVGMVYMGIWRHDFVGMFWFAVVWIYSMTVRLTIQQPVTSYPDEMFQVDTLWSTPSSPQSDLDEDYTFTSAV